MFFFTNKLDSFAEDNLLTDNTQIGFTKVSRTKYRKQKQKINLEG